MAFLLPRPGVWFPLLALTLGATRAAGAPLEGRWEAAGLGLLELTEQEGGRLVAQPITGSTCPLAAGVPVLEGQLEGSVLVGKVTLCQRGPSCETRAYPVLAFFHSGATPTLSALVKLDSGCSSDAVQDTVLTLTRVGDLPSGQVGGPEASTVSAADVAARAGLTGAERQQLLASLVERGHALLQAHRARESVAVWQEMLGLEPTSWLAHLGMGLAQLELDQLPRAQQELELALQYAPPQAWDIHYNLACLHARKGDRARSLDYLEEAVRRGFDMPESMARDKDLSTLLRNDVAFQRLVQKAAVNKRKNSPRRSGQR